MENRFCFAVVMYVVLNVQYSLGTKGGLIYDGEIAKEGTFTYSAFLTMSGQRRLMTCGASIVNQRVLLSAAHCFQLPFEKVRLLVGNVNVRKAHAVKISHYHKHENFSDVKAGYDIALVFTAREINFNWNVSRVALLATPPMEDCYVAGWGVTDPKSRKKTPNLIYVKQRIVDGETCKRKYFMQSKINASSIVCNIPKGLAGYPVFGDSGSALVTRDYIQVGLVSMGFNEVIVYTRIEFYLDWIQSTIRGHCSK